MTSAHVLRSFLDSLDAQDWDKVRAVLADDFRGHYPHDGRHFDADGLVAYNQDYPGRWSLQVVELLVEGDRAVARTRVTGGTQTFWVASFARVDGDGLIHELVEVWAGPVPE